MSSPAPTGRPSRHLPSTIRLPRWHPREADGRRKVIAPGRRRIISWDTIEDVFFVLTTVFCFWMAWQVWQEGTGWWQGLLGIIIVWAVIAYLAMPRVNRILTSIYVPDYFFGRTQATGGVLGDPINLAFTGDHDQLVTAMHRAGWTMAKPITLRSAWGIIRSSLTGRSDPSAPVSSLFLFRRMQDMAFEQEVDGNARQRHHVRFWRTPDDWLLPGGHRVDWLAAGSYDRAVGLSLFTLQVTHKIDADIDAERDHIITTLLDAEPGLQVDVLKDFATGYHSRNGGGDRVYTDGNLPIVRLDDVEPAGGATIARRHLDPRDVGSRPPSVVLAVTFSLVLTLVGVLNAVLSGIDHREGTVDLVLDALLAVVMVVLAVQTYRGIRWARLALLALSAVSLGSQWDIGHTGSGLLGMGLDLAIMYSLTSDQARNWTRSDDQQAHDVHTGTVE